MERHVKEVRSAVGGEPGRPHPVQCSLLDSPWLSSYLCVRVMVLG